MPISVHKTSDYGRNLKRIREQRGMTQVELAEAVGLQQRAISSLETGVNQPYLTTAAKIAEALKTKLEKFLEKTTDSA